MSQCLSFSFSPFIYFVFSPKRHSPSTLVFGMVLIGWSDFNFSFLFFLTAVTKLIGVVRAEVSVAPNVELMGRQRHILLTIMKQITIKHCYVPHCFEWDFNNLSSTLDVKWLREKKERESGREIESHRAMSRERALL